MVTAIWDTAVVAIITVGAAAVATTMVIDGELISDDSDQGRPSWRPFSFQQVAPCRLADALACPRAGIAA